MIIRKGLIVFLTFSFFLKVSAQTSGSTYNIDLPQLLPASPEPSAFVKAGVGNVNLATGAATANIPLYSIKIKDFTFPLSLSYSAQGLKADEATSRTGYGWILNATGMITRVVKGKPDELAYRLKPPREFFADTDSVFNYLNSASNESGYDSQADEFQFNFNGYSGKFVLDSNYIPRLTSTNNFKITAGLLVGSGGGIDFINITTPDGVVYKFGNNYEMTITHNVQQFTVYKDRTKTAFFLDKIELPTGEYINFNYTPIHIRVTTGTTQTLKIGKFNGGQLGGCIDCAASNGHTTQSQTIEYNTNYLSNITTSDGRNIDLTYEARPDKSYDNRLTGLEVQGLKKYLFQYYDVPGSTNVSTGINGRFFLTKLREIKLAEAIDTTMSYDYTFTYDKLDQVPLPITFAQDYLGFYNGRTSNNCLIPPYLNSNNEIDVSFRLPVAYWSETGMLTSIKYPTGGKEEYFYEGNTQAKSVLRNTMVTETLSGRGDESSSNLFKTYTSNSFFVSKDHQSTLSLWATDADLSDGNTQTENHWTLIVDFYDGDTRIKGLTSFDYNTSTLEIPLQAGHSYWWKMTVRTGGEFGYSTLLYDTASRDYYDTINQIIPGIRVKQIKYSDPVTASTHSKYYKYAKLDNLNISTGSGGGAGPGGVISFKSYAGTRHYCGQPIGEIETDCSYEIYSSSSTQDVYNYSGSGSVIYYNTVIESDDPGFANGGTEYTFYENESGSNHMTAFGQDVSGLPAGQTPTLSGTVFKTRVFNKDKQVVQEEQNDYETSIDLSNAVESYYVRVRYPTNIALVDRMDAFDAVKMLYGSYWIRLKTKTVKIYSGTDVLIQKTDYTYGARTNILPAAITTTDSKKLQVKTEKKYPTDFPTEGANSKLIIRNIITPLVEESSYRNGTLLQRKHVIYKDWFNDSKVLTPEKIQVKESPDDNLQDALIYSKYDKTSNPLQLKKVDDVSIVYLWDSLHALPLCEVRNASFEQIAFSGFENGNNYGNWQFTSGGVTLPGFTGYLSFTGSLTKTLTIPGIYIVRLWTNSSATVNGSAGTPLRSAQGWNLYQWVLTNPTTVTISGTRLDDLRLYPQNAQMATYTYKPFIGVTSKSDDNNNVQYYEYDFMGRLSLIRDQDGNILKKYCYNYAGQVEDCGMDMTPLWQSTGVTRCKACPTNSTYLSNIQEHQEKDNNPYSTSFNTFRWVEDGVSSSCVPQADWQQINLYCEQNGSGQYTGNQIRVEQDKNPCSPTYNNTRNITLVNCATCPKPGNYQSTGNYRCVKDASNNNTGAQEREEKDMESCSATYNQLRWVSNGTNCATCPKPSSWQATGNYRCVVSGGVNTGAQEREEKDMESCSGTFNQLRWVSNGTNCATCPKPQVWQPTDNYRCVTSGGLNTGLQEREEINVEGCSVGYNTLRWVSNGTNCATCPKPQNWQSTGNYRCVTDAENNNTGAQEREERDIESCSGTYNQLRWVSVGTNCTTCPKPQSWQPTGNYRCVKDANNVNTGYQEREEKNVETCSFNPNSLRWILFAYNSPSCPVPCNTSNCSGNDRKCLNGTCEVGTLITISSVYQKVLVNGVFDWRWVCTKKYCFSDGSLSTWSQTTYELAACSVTTCSVE